jgi:tRNA(Arg) A34 adenosine deaminase TadA
MTEEERRLLALEEPWRTAVTLAWGAFVGGNVGVGAVLTDPQGVIAAVGRNRVSDQDAPPGRLRSTFLAHAEIDVLGQLPPGDHEHYTLWTTLEPCALCSIAIVMGNIGSVVFAARDRLWRGISRLTEVNEFIASGWPARQGPLHGPVSVFCELLPLFWFLDRKPNGTVVQNYQTQHPRLLALAKRLRDDIRFSDLKTRDLHAVLSHLWADLAAIEPDL